MDLLCIKQIEPYWGPAFEKGKWYSNFSERNHPTTLIIDEVNYWKYNKLIIQSKDFPDYKQEEMWKVIPGYLTHKQIGEKFCKIIQNCPYFDIKGDDNQINSFCTLTKKELLEQYGSTKFELSIRLLEDYFISLEDIREDKIKNILEI